MNRLPVDVGQHGEASGLCPPGIARTVSPTREAFRWKTLRPLQTPRHVTSHPMVSPSAQHYVRLMTAKWASRAGAFAFSRRQATAVRHPDHLEGPATAWSTNQAGCENAASHARLD